MKSNYDAVVVGCGFAGGVIARELADKYQKRVLLLERRPHIAGNMYESEDVNGIRVHWYGPHILHTPREDIFSYIGRFTEYTPYQHVVLGRIDGKLVPIPFNFTGIDELFPAEKAALLKEKLTRAYPGQLRVPIGELLAAADPDIRHLAEFIYEKVFVHYTAKQWGQSIEEISPAVFNRIPVVLGYDRNHFTSRYQYMPKEGFTRLFERLLDHPAITVELNSDAIPRIDFDFASGRVFFDGAEWKGPLVYTGALDELLDNRFGRLPYRSLDLVFEQLPETLHQPVAVVNYPNEEKFTRITEFKHLTGQQKENATTILKEYPLAYDPQNERAKVPYYPIINAENQSLYQQYRDLVDGIENVFLCGRLAEYKYYDMNSCIIAALGVAEKIGEYLEPKSTTTP